MKLRDKIRVKRKINKLCNRLKAEMTPEDYNKSHVLILNLLREMRAEPYDKKEKLIDICLRVIG